MIKSAFGLGVLSIPFVFQAVGIVPGIILIVVIEFITTCKSISEAAWF